MLDWKEVFIKRNVKFRGKDLLRIKRVLPRNFSRTSRASSPVPFIKASNISRSVARLVLTRWSM